MPKQTLIRSDSTHEVTLSDDSPVTQRKSRKKVTTSVEPVAVEVAVEPVAPAPVEASASSVKAPAKKRAKAKPTRPPQTSADATGLVDEAAAQVDVTPPTTPTIAPDISPVVAPFSEAAEPDSAPAAQSVDAHTSQTEPPCAPSEPQVLTMPVIAPEDLWEQDNPVKQRLGELRTRNARLSEQIKKLNTPLQARGQRS